MADMGESSYPDSQVGSSRQASEAPTTRKRRNARTACLNCKKRKLKCSADIPCQSCLRNGTSCLMNEDTDQRRKHALKRKLSGLEQKGQLLDDLIRTLQTTDEECAAQVLTLVRAHASLEQIRAYLDDVGRSCDDFESTPELKSAIEDFQNLDEIPRSASRPRLDDQKQSEKVIFDVPSTPWTKVTNDDQFVSRLISLWFTWAHPYLNWIDRDLFIRDMLSGDTDAKFCSPFLVNVILADACAYFDYLEVYEDFDEEWPRALDFYEEAKRLLAQQEGKISIVNVQGLCGLYVVSCMIGKDRAGWAYYGQLAYATQELSRRHRLPPDGADEETIRGISAIDNALWGIFNFASVTALAYQKGALISAPRHRHRTPEHDVHQDTWHPYPMGSDVVKSHRECLFTALCDMGQIIHELSLSLFKDNSQTLDIEFSRVAEELHGRLRAWYEDLPDCLATSDATPHVLSLHMNYHTTIQTIFGYLKGVSTSADVIESELAQLDTVRQQAREICLISARKCAGIVDQQRGSWGLDYMPPTNIHWFTVSMYTLLEDLSDDANRRAFISLTIAAKAASHRWVLAKGMLRLVQLTSIQTGVSLPPETDALFSDFEARVWTSQDRRALSSQYPHFTHSMKRGEVGEVELDAFLEKFDDLHIARTSESSVKLEEHGGRGLEEVPEEASEKEDETEWS
ncbi:uncharacterized protein N7506_008787 [Penicillium brevicompactum]|uniref:uncharacterized protein n=1 Tax=Penicillium brevicompactum TaxID=5074 RepID=UPI00253FDBC9|nr:uncharacterized protein N7506_008787 [Penicillium brevicompactum]KAJ5325685.1 hypothetical protein N7506_008787 [Penicillium brevicompactum]